MDKHILPLTGVKPTNPGPSAKSVKTSEQEQSFDQLLKQKGDSLSGRSQVSSSPSLAAKMLVGEISQKEPTVSELLIHNSALKQSTWNILLAPQNKEKNYTQLPVGTKVYFDQEHKTLSWSNSPHSQDENSIQPLRSQHPQEIEPSRVTSELKLQESREATTIHLGQISKQYPTVSHLLRADPNLRDETWNILSTTANKNKDFTAIHPSSEVRVDPVSKEIFWSSRDQRTGAERVRLSEGNLSEQSPAMQVSAIENQQKHTTPANPIVLGKIDQNNPTVSHLLTQQPELKNRIWDLLSNSVNKGKAFDQIAKDTQIYLHPGSMEISWKGQQGNPPPQTTESIASIAPRATKVYHANQQNWPQPFPAADLTEAVQPFLGSSYKDIDCYELLVKGLDRMDIPYNGKDGLFSKLRQMALEKGLPANAYLNGEGIVKAAGSLVLSKNFPSSTSSRWQKDSAALYKEMEPLLDKGQILSFSTRYRGHTGIISQQDKQWTFINSGRLDNALTSNTPSKGVGEEDLHKELRNWFKLAHKSNETLTVTLGQLEQHKVAAAYTGMNSIAKRI